MILAKEGILLTGRYGLPAFLSVVIVFLMQYVLTGCRGHIWVRPTSAFVFVLPATLLIC